MEKINTSECPICKSKRIKMDRYYHIHCEDCKSEWQYTHGGFVQVIVDMKKEFVL